jgi:hypothetical protein
MLSIKLKSKRPPVVPYKYTGYTPPSAPAPAPMQQQQVHQPPTPAIVTDINTKEKNKKLFDEALRRDKIIRDLVAECKYTTGERVMFIREADEKKYGRDVWVTKIVESYGQWPKNEAWPDNDNPMIVHLCVKDKNDEALFCTVNMVKPYNSVEAEQRGK